MSVVTKYDIDAIAQATLPERKVSYAAFYDSPSNPSKIYFLGDFHDVRTQVELSVFDLNTGNFTSSGTLIANIPEESNWYNGTFYSGCYCEYNSTIFCALYGSIVVWDDPTATVLETSTKYRFATKNFASDNQHVYVFSGDSNWKVEIQKWDLSTNTQISIIEQPWTESSEIRFMDFLEDGTAWIMSHVGDIYKGTWDRSGNMTACTDHTLIYTDNGILGNSQFRYSPFAYVNNLLVIVDALNLTYAAYYNYDIVAGTLTQTFVASQGESERWPGLLVDTTRGEIHVNELYGGFIYTYDLGFLLNLTPYAISILVEWSSDESSSYRVTYTPSGGAEKVVLITTDLSCKINNLDIDTDYDVSIYSSTDDINYTLTETRSTTTLSHSFENYDKYLIDDGGNFDISSLNSVNKERIKSVSNDLFNTGDSIITNTRNSSYVKSFFVERGDMFNITNIEAILIPFESNAGSGQSISVTLADLSTETIIFNEVDETITIDGNIYSSGQVFVFNDKKTSVFSV